MEKTSKITVCKFISEWAGPSGTVYYHEIHLQNGDSGQIGTKEKYPAKLEPDQELTYTIESTSRGNKIKAVSASGSGSGYKGGKPQRDPKEQMISFATAYTKDLIVAGKIDIKDLEPAVKRMYQVMKSLYEA